MRRELSRALTARVRASHGDDEVARECAEALELEVHFADGEYGAAEQAARRMHQRQRRKHGDEDEVTLDAAGSIALALAKQGKHSDAARVQRAVLDARMRVGSEDEGTVAAMGGLANALSEQGNHADAKLLNEKALAISTRVLGADHITTLALRCISAWSLALKGDYADAVDETRRVLAVHTRMLGEEHPITITTKSQSLFGHRKCDEAVHLEREVLAAFRRLDPRGSAALASEERLATMLDRPRRRGASQGRAR
jgi:tetratricopeptide (TPR) repeat protein